MWLTTCVHGGWKSRTCERKLNSQAGSGKGKLPAFVKTFLMKTGIRTSCVTVSDSTDDSFCVI
jgi:hypothetical protein